MNDGIRVHIVILTVAVEGGGDPGAGASSLGGGLVRSRTVPRSRSVSWAAAALARPARRRCSFSSYLRYGLLPDRRLTDFQGQLQPQPVQCDLPVPGLAATFVRLGANARQAMHTHLLFE